LVPTEAPRRGRGAEIFFSYFRWGFNSDGCDDDDDVDCDDDPFDCEEGEVEGEEG